jgi:hypothetical protein
MARTFAFEDAPAAFAMQTSPHDPHRPSETSAMPLKTLANLAPIMIDGRSLSLLRQRWSHRH